MGLFNIKKKNKKALKFQIKPAKTLDEPLDKLINGELPFGWAGKNRMFTEKIASESRYFLDFWLNSRSKSPKEQYAALKSFILYLNDCKKLCASQGECHLKWFQDIIADDSYIQARTEELKEIEKNYKKLEAEYEKRQNIEKNILPKLQQDLLAFITANPNTLQKDIYKVFAPELKDDIQNLLYHWGKEGKIIRTKHGNTYSIQVPK